MYQDRPPRPCPPPCHSQRGHTGATSGPRTTGSQRTTPVTPGPVSQQFTARKRSGIAGHQHRPALPDTEEVTGSNPVAPTTPLLSRDFVNSVVRRVARRPMLGRLQRQESTSLLNQGVRLRAPEPVSGPLAPSPGSDIRHPRRRLVGTGGPWTDSWKRLPTGPRPLAEPDLVGSPELILEQARWPINKAQPLRSRRSARPVALCLETVSEPLTRSAPQVGMRSLPCDSPCLRRVPSAVLRCAFT